MLPSLLSYGGQPKFKIFQKYLISRSLWKTFLIKCSKIFMAKALAFILRSVSLKLLENFGIDCYVLRRIPENLTESDDFSNFAGLLLRVYIKILFNIFLNFGWVFFQTAMVGCFYKERIINNNLFCSYCLFNKILREGIFYPGMKYLYGKYCPGYGEILPWTSRIPPSWDRMENALVSYKRNKKFTTNACFLLISFIVLSRLLFHLRSHINSPLDGSSKCLFQWLIHSKDSNSLKQ